VGVFAHVINSCAITRIARNEDGLPGVYRLSAKLRPSYGGFTALAVPQIFAPLPAQRQELPRSMPWPASPLRKVSTVLASAGGIVGGPGLLARTQ